MVKWLNHVTIAAPRNGTNSHTIDPSSGTVVAGALFTPTSGRLLVCVVEGAVTSTTPSGWTLPSGGSAINNTGLYVWYRTAVGGDTFSTTHNGSNYPVVFDIYEFPAGSTFIGSAAQGNVSASGGAGPSLSGLTSSANWRAAAVGQDISGAAPSSFTWSNGTEAVDTSIAASGTDGYGYSLTYLEDETGATYSSAATSTITFTSCERLVFAFNIPAGANTGTLSASLPRVTSTLDASASDPGTVAASVPRVTSSLSGTATDPGTLSAALPRATASVAGNSINPASMSPALPRASSSVSGTALNSGALAAAAPSLTGSVSGESGDAAALAVTLPGLSASLSGTATNSGSLAASTALLSAAMSGSEVTPIEGVLSADLPATSWASAGESRNPGSFVASLSQINGFAQGEQKNSGSMSAVAVPMAIVVAGTALHSGDLLSSAPLLTASIDGSAVNSGELSGSVFLIRSELNGDSAISGSLDAELPSLGLFIEDLGARRDVVVLGVGEVPVVAVTVVEVVRPVVIQEVSA